MVANDRLGDDARCKRVPRGPRVTHLFPQQILVHDAEIDQDRVLDDIKKLMKLSQIG